MKAKISLGSIIFWGFIGWMWIGDTVTEVFHEITKTAVVATVDGEKTVIDVDKLIDNAVKKAESVIADDSESEPPPPPKEKEMIAKDDNFSNDDLYGDQGDKYR
jgi:hypothetical protein